GIGVEVIELDEQDRLTGWRGRPDLHGGRADDVEVLGQRAGDEDGVLAGNLQRHSGEEAREAGIRAWHRGDGPGVAVRRVRDSLRRADQRYLGGRRRARRRVWLGAETGGRDAAGLGVEAGDPGERETGARIAALAL